MVAAARFDVVLVHLDPTRGSEIRKTRPYVVISPDEMNQSLRTFVVAPLSTSGRTYPWRVPVMFGGKAGHVVLDQIRTIDRERAIRRLGKLEPATSAQVLDVLSEMFAP